MADSRSLVRALGRRDLVFLMVNSTVGAGILGLPGKVYALLGVYSVFACLAGGILVGLVGACYAEASSRYPGTGASILYARAAFGPRTAFITGWLAVATRLFAYASIINLAVNYAAGLWPPIAEPIGRVGAITAISLGLGTVIYIGVTLSAGANALFTVAKLALLARLRAHRPVLPAGAPLERAAAGAAARPLVTRRRAAAVRADRPRFGGGERRGDARPAAATSPLALFAGLAMVVALYSGILLVWRGRRAEPRCPRRAAVSTARLPCSAGQPAPSWSPER